MIATMTTTVTAATITTAVATTITLVTLAATTTATTTTATTTTKITTTTTAWLIHFSEAGFDLDKQKTNRSLLLLYDV